jgi:hypothetical protein
MMGLIYFENKDLEKCLENWKKYINYSSDEIKKKKLQEVVMKFEQQIFEEKRKLEEIRLKQEEEKRRIEEEKRKKEEFLKSLMQELEKDKTDSQSLEEYKIKKKKSDIEFEEVQ